MYNTIVENYKLKIKKCDNESDLASVVSFFNEYEISRQNRPVDIDKLKEVKLLILDDGSIYSLLVLQDGRIAAGTDSDTIQIINPKSDYSCDETINTIFTPLLYVSYPTEISQPSEKTGVFNYLILRPLKRNLPLKET